MHMPVEQSISSSRLEQRTIRLDWKTLVLGASLLMQVISGVYAYGKLVERVDQVNEQVRELRALILQKR